MGDRGLDTSIWASRGIGSGNSFTRLGDWDCPSCGFSNFQRRTECMRCSTSRAGTPRSSSPAVTTVHQNNMPPQVEHASTSGSLWGVSTNPSTPMTTAPSSDRPPKVEKGLSDSLWAPRNYSGRVKKADSSQVWVKKRSQNNVNANTQASATNSSSSPPPPPDLGLPYEVQHFILAMIQRILEEGCYDFAYRWIPGVLNERNWSCAEAVELSTWRDFLPNALPPNALVPVPGYSLYLGLKDAVRIRNSAVHRHLSDNFEIRRMAQQAENLVTMFSDVTRQNKFRRLGAELVDWDKYSGGDQQVARAKLEQALQEISERPMDDMDWTPNAVSLQEITSEIQVHDTQDYEDAMELD